MRTIFLHIGTHKTGSTSIQNSLEGYDDGKTRYANLKWANHSIAFYTSFSEDYRNYHIWKNNGLNNNQIDDKRADYLRLIERSLEQDVEKNIIYSGEDISNISAEGIIRIKNMLIKHSAKIHIIAYVRSPISFKQSWLQQTIKMGNNVHITEFQGYINRFQKFIDTFGIENISFRYFDEIKDVVSDFCQLVNVNIERKPRYDNKSLSTEAIKCIYILNKFIAPHSASENVTQAVSKFHEMLSEILPGRFSFPEDLLYPYVDRNDYQWMQETMGVNFGINEKKLGGVKSSKEIEYFFESPSAKTLDCLIETLKRFDIDCDFDRCPASIINHLFIAYFLQIQKDHLKTKIPSSKSYKYYFKKVKKYLRGYIKNSLRKK